MLVTDATTDVCFGARLVSLWFHCFRRDLDRLGRHSVHRERELVLRDRAQSIRGQDSSQRADSGDERGSEEQEGSVDEGQSFTSESSSSREGGSMTEDGTYCYVILHLHSPTHGPCTCCLFQCSESHQCCVS